MKYLRRLTFLACLDKTVWEQNNNQQKSEAKEDMKVLLIEANPDRARVLKTQLAVRGHIVVWSESGKSALFSFRKVLPFFDAVTIGDNSLEFHNGCLSYELLQMQPLLPILILGGKGIEQFSLRQIVIGRVCPISNQFAEMIAQYGAASATN